MAERFDPIVPHVMLPAGQRARLYDLPDIRRVPVLWHTATTVRYAFDNGDKQQWTTGQDRVWCVPDDDAWAEIEESYAAWREALRAFAAQLRLLGTYERRLKDAGEGAPNPLTPTVVIADNPDGWQGSFHGDDLFLLPGEQNWRPFERAEVLRHTPKMVRLASDDLVDQTKCFVCPSDEDWNAVNGAMLAAREARDTFKRVLNKYGSYGRAVTRRQYEQEKQQEEPVVAIPTTADDREVMEVEEIETLRQHGYDALRLDMEHWLIWELGSADESERRVNLAELRTLAAELESTLVPAAPEMHDLPLDQLYPHPDNPRLTMREEVVEAIAARLRETGRFEPVHALRVRPLERGYQIIAGHHRREAAERVGLTTVPCWVQILDDTTAYMELATDNNQGELTPLEVGLHAYGAVELGKGGRGQQGGLSAYARQIGRSHSRVSQLVAAARVYQAMKPVTQVTGFEARTKQLYEISRAPQEHWLMLVQGLLNHEWTTEATREAVEELFAVALTEEELVELQRQVRRRGGVYHGARRLNGLITRHNVTMPGQSERQYTTEQLREVLPAFAEQEEQLWPDLREAWDLEDAGALLVARHRATGVATEPGMLAMIGNPARACQVQLDQLHADGWRFTYDPAASLWTAEHDEHMTVMAQTMAGITNAAWRSGDQTLSVRARDLTRAGEFDQAEQLILSMRLDDLRDGAMRFLSQHIRAAKEEAQRARWEAMPEPEPDRTAMQEAHNLLEAAEQTLPAWTFWVDDEGTCGAMHASGYKIGPLERAIELVNEAHRLTPLLAEFAEYKWTCGYHVGLDLWTAEHMQYGTVQASSLPDLAFNAYLARYDRREPDLPRDLWQATWLEGWQFEGHLPGDRYRFVRGGEAWEPSYAELCHVYDYEEQPTPAPAFPQPISHQVPADLAGWEFAVVDAHHVRGTHPDHGEIVATGGAEAAFTQARFAQRHIDRHAVHFSSESAEWYTPPHIIGLARDVLGVIDLDPASCAEANQTVMAHRYYDQLAGGLGLHWHGRVWLNPPYGQVIEQWTQHLVEEYTSGNIDAALALLPARPDTQWFAPMFDYPRCWISGRLHFTGAKDSAPFPSVVVYLGPEVERFAEVFGQVGHIDLPYDWAQQNQGKRGAEQEQVA